MSTTRAAVAVKVVDSGGVDEGPGYWAFGPGIFFKEQGAVPASEPRLVE